MERKALNVLGEPLKTCSMDPLTGYLRDGCCHTGEGDYGVHVVCARVTTTFLEFSKAQGNDLSTPSPQYGFAGLKDGDQWCLCVSRWKDAFDKGMAPLVDLSATHISALEWVSLAQLREYSTETSDKD